jgi:membrane protease YdiL (CAAX protease family)
MIYLVVLSILCAAFIIGAKLLGEQGVYLAQAYMLTPAMAALIVRFFFYKPKFKDANLRFGKIKDYFKFWLVSIGITILSYGIYTLLGAIAWDFTGQGFLGNMAQQFAAMGQDINDTLPPGFTPKMMLWIFFVGGLTVFNILPGIITGFGEEFGHRGFMFPQLYKIKPWVGLIIGGLIWYAWHLPLMFIIPQTVQVPLWQATLNFVVLAVGSVCTFIYLAYVYLKSESIWITSLAHITMNNAAASYAYFVIIQNQLLANLGLSLTMVIVVALLFYKNQINVFAAYFDRS